MSAFFHASSDAYLYQDGGVLPVINKAYPLTIVGKFKMNSAQGIANFIAVGAGGILKYDIRKDSNDTIRFNIDSAPDVTHNTTMTVEDNEWYFFAMIINSLTDRSYYLERMSDGLSEWTNDNVTVQTAWATEEISLASIGSLRNTGSVETIYNQDQFQANHAIIDGVLSEVQCSALAQGGDYANHTVLKHWLEDDMTDWKNESVDAQVLTIWNGATGDATPPTNPPVYSADHPAMGSGEVVPVLSDINLTTTTTTVDIEVSTTTGEGTIWAGVFADGATPTHAQIKAGTGALGSGMVSLAVTGSGVQNLPQITGLTASTAYEVWITQEDTVPTEAVPITSGVTTAAPATAKIRATIVQDASQTAYGSQTGLHYVVLGDTNGDAFTVEYDGVDGSTNAAGLFEIDTPNHVADDTLTLVIFGGVTTDIHIAGAKRSVGTITVIEV